MPRTEIIARLKENGVSPTQQRVEIAQVLLERPRHLAADQILDELHAAGSQISKATVYNTLRLFSEKGLVRELNVDASRTFYDSTTHPHHHFYNVDSGQLKDIPADQVKISNLPRLPTGTEKESVEVLIRVRDK